MLPVITFIILLFSIIYFFISLKKIGIDSSSLFLRFRSGLILPQNLSNKNKFLKFWSIIQYIIINLTLLLFIFMLLSSFIPTAITGDKLSGIFLVIHITIAPLFSLALALMVLLFSHQMQFNKSDFDQFAKETSINRNDSLIKIAFWSLSVLSVPLLFSIILILYPLFGTELQNFYITIHRITSLLFSIVVLAIIYFAVISKRK
jgi:hypothetical protein